MFQCKVCKTTVSAHTPAQHIVLEARERIYPPRKGVHRTLEPRKKGPKKGPKKLEWTHDPGGRGWEIVCEVKVCPACAAKHRLNSLLAQ